MTVPQIPGLPDSVGLPSNIACRCRAVPVRITVEAQETAGRRVAAVRQLANAAHSLAMLGLQSERFQEDPDYRLAVMDVLQNVGTAGEPPRESTWDPDECVLNFRCRDCKGVILIKAGELGLAVAG